ncbi:putative LysR family transcriptional regulator (plasmid) [Sinorhizobium fredii NGR234]|uniref:LysR family transcriptional regulator n=1 Tax=Sinorhizobium fredii (strain NBRC 101917 / NGR234) TaxID=394 RepID=C3KN33_SINFN|nr:LysR family transcriptional regulator [Sinorhizobium fredii]ACP21606.1 putative LysR family transcriptional regulator [Sinorhizobium fredii NGR234]
MIKFDGIAAFVATAEAGSISAASRRLGLAKSVVSERLAELERILGTKLIQRTTRKLSLTENGQTFLPRAQRILREADEAAAELAARSGKLAGPLRLSAPVSFGILHLAPALTKFIQEHPQIEVSVELDDRFVDAAAGGFDAVLRHGAIGDSRLIARRLATSRRLLVASPAYLEREGHPASIDELQHHCGILYSMREGDWRFSTEHGWQVVRPKAALRANNGLVMREAAMAGLGITLLPTFFIHEAVKSGVLVPIDVGARAEGAELFITYPRDHGASAKIRALADSLQRSFGNPPYWDRLAS